MKTRKILALLLAIIMIGGMLPTAFAADAAESVSVTYSFYKGGRSDVASDWLENFTWTPAAEILDGNTEYAIERNADYMAFPESSENPNDQWAYVGSGMGRSASYVTPTTGKGTLIGLNSDLNSEGNPGFGFINTYTGGSGSWIAFKIKVPETALYKISGVTAFAYSNASSNIGVYVVPVADELAETVTAAAASGSFSATAYTGTDTRYTGKYLVYRNNFTTFANLGIDSDYLMGKTNIYEASGNNYSSERDVTSINAQTLEADKEYYLFLQADSGAMTIKSITLTETTAEAEAVTNPVFNFGLSAFKDTSKIADSGNYKRLINATSYNYINTSVSTGRWAYVTNFYMSNNLVESDDSLFCATDLEHNVIILKLEVGKSGIYKPTFNFEKYNYNGKLNIWTIPATEDVSKYTGYTQAYDLIDKAQYVGSVDLYNDTPVESYPFVGNDVYMKAGDNYLIMTITKGAETVSSGKYYAYIESLALERKAGVVLSAEKKELIKGGATTLSTYVADADNNPLDASVTYESLNPTVATVDNATGIVTAVSVGTATIKATAVTANGTYTDTIEITVNTKWDMTYIFTNSVVASQTGTAANPPLNTVTALKDDVTDSWEYVNQIGLGAGGLYSDGIQYQCYPDAFLDDGENKNVIVLKLNFPETGTYLPTLGAMRRTYCGKNDIYLVPKSYADSKWNMSSSALPIAEIVSDAGVTNIISANLYHSSNESTPKLFEGDAYNVDENEIYMIIVLRNNDENIINDSSRRLWGYPRYLEMTRTGSVKLLADKTELTKGDTTTLITAVKDNRDNAATADVTLTSLNTAVATVSGNTVTAVAPGTATIKATATVDGVEVSDTVEITVGAQTADNTVSFAAYSSIAGESVSVSGIVYDEEVKPVSRGTPITVVAPEVEGYTFRYWKRGSSTNGKWISNDSTYSFSLMTNTMLTAVYDENVETEGKKVEFWNQNGTYLETKTVPDGEFVLPKDPTLTGFTFKGWYVNGKDKLDVSKLTAAITRAVAQYDANAISGSVTVGGEPESEIVYNKKITKTVPGATVWKRDQKPVAYGETYTYYVWDATDITCETAAISEKEPLIIIESGNGGAFMIEYDAGDKQIVEAGIVFGDGATVDVCQAKATSQKNLSHGQFTATSDYSAARGYIIYKDNGNYIVKYSD